MKSKALFFATFIVLILMPFGSCQATPIYIPYTPSTTTVTVTLPSIASTQTQTLTQTVTQPAQTLAQSTQTIFQPAQTVTLPPTTVTATATNSQTTTITTQTITLPPATTTVTIPPATTTVVITITLPPTTITTTPSQSSYTLSVTVSPSAAQIANCSIAMNGVSIYSSGFFTITPGTQVSVLAYAHFSTAPPYWSFRGWSGTYTSTDNPLNFIMPASNISLQANFIS